MPAVAYERSAVAPVSPASQKTLSPSRSHEWVRVLSAASGSLELDENVVLVLMSGAAGSIRKRGTGGALTLNVKVVAAVAPSSSVTRSPTVCIPGRIAAGG